MIGLYLVPTRLRTTNQLWTNQLSHDVRPNRTFVNQFRNGLIIGLF